jgi:exopolysaccharide biosynthesis WecB/TagA/CpsF family protein
MAPPTLDLDSDSSGKRVDYIGDQMPVTLLQYPSQGWRTTVRATGQFLPRWIVTLVTMLGLYGLELWMRSRTTDRARPGANDEKLICKFDNYDLNGFSAVVRDYGQHRFGYVVTPNVDHLIRLHDDRQFRDLYAGAEFVLLDSRFLANLLRVSGLRLPVCTGSDLTAKLFDTMSPTDGVVIIGGGKSQISALTKTFGLRNVAHHNPPMGFIHDDNAVEQCLQFVEAHSPFRYCLLAVGSPQQEKLARLLQSRGVARGLALCVGASIDFITGSEKRAPLWMQQHGIEWTYRLMQNPARLAKRYLVRGPRIFWLLRRTKFTLRPRREKDEMEDEAKAA